jgi:phosphotransferase system enzyme I (PtsP)
VDFLSVGSNDLLQFFFAIDRGNAKVANRFDPLSAPVLRALKRVADVAGAAQVPVTVCGELAGKPLEAITLAAIGYRSISMSPAAIGPVKSAILALDLSALAREIVPLIESGEHVPDLRRRVAAFAETHEVPV